MDQTVTEKKFFYNKHISDPLPGSLQEKLAFAEIQNNFSKQFENFFHDKLAAKTIVIIPSLTLDQQMLRKIRGHVYYEERMLCLLMLLRMPMTKIIFLTSIPIDDAIVDYYLHLLPGITGRHARQRLVMLSCYDASTKSLTEKILERPRLLEKIKQHIPDKDAAHLSCFNVTNFERTLAVKLGIPLYGANPDLLYMGTKSGSRKLFKACGVTVPDGYEDVKNREEVIHALANLKRKNPSLRRAVVKMNDGFGGEGNAVFEYENIKADDQLDEKIEVALSHQLKIVATDVDEKLYFEKFDKMGGVVEVFVEGVAKASPSVQCRINPLKQTEIISTHDQLLGGVDKQVFLGAFFPASNEYSGDIAAAAKTVSEELAWRGVLGRFSIDFISVKENDKWNHYGIEINLRKGGTTHPYLMLTFLTDGIYNSRTGEYLTASGSKRFYFASDNVSSERYRGLTPPDLIDIAIFHSLMYDGATQEGVMFHLMGALSQYGKFGMVCIGRTREKAWQLYEKVIHVLDYECS
jgi:hypothetical protein